MRDADGAVDYQHPGGETIELAVLKAPAADPDGADRLAGRRPRRSGCARHVDYAARRRLAAEALPEHFDIVGMDPRGAGESAPVDCLSDEELDAYLAGDPDPDTPEEAAEFQAANESSPRAARPTSGRPGRATSPRSRRPATWTCCGRRSARRS